MFDFSDLRSNTRKADGIGRRENGTGPLPVAAHIYKGYGDEFHPSYTYIGLFMYLFIFLTSKSFGDSFANRSTGILLNCGFE